MASLLKAPISFISRKEYLLPSSALQNNRKCRVTTIRMSSVSQDKSSSFMSFPIMVNGCTGKMGRAVIDAATSAGVQLLPVSFSSEEEAGQIMQIGGQNIQVHGPSDRESVLASVYDEHPDMIVVDYTVPAAVNANAELYCKVGVPFVMGTTGGDRERLYKTVEDSKVYAVISPQMGKQVVAFIAAMEIMAEQFPGAFAGYSLQVMESHQASKLDTSGTAKAVIACFQKLGVNFELNEIQQIRDPEYQVQMVGVPEEHLLGHAFHMYHLQSPDETESRERVELQREQMENENEQGLNKQTTTMNNEEQGKQHHEKDVQDAEKFNEEEREDELDDEPLQEDTGY